VAAGVRCSGPQSVTAASIVSRRAGRLFTAGIWQGPPHWSSVAARKREQASTGGQDGAGGAHGTTGGSGDGQPSPGRLLFTALGRTLVDGALVRTAPR
jgi:hypothetical protein